MFAYYSLLDQLIKKDTDAEKKLKTEYQVRSQAPKLTTMMT